MGGQKHSRDDNEQRENHKPFHGGQAKASHSRPFYARTKKPRQSARGELNWSRFRILHPPDSCLENDGHAPSPPATIRGMEPNPYEAPRAVSDGLRQRPPSWLRDKLRLILAATAVTAAVMLPPYPIARWLIGP